jgi:AcrR family transcriptional regulator
VTDRAEGRKPLSRKPRADSLRNRERLIEAAKAGFAAVGQEVTLEEIARRAGVGIGTLYRHFPSREAMVEAVYRREVEQIAEAAARLLATERPGEALHRWMLMFVDYIAAKRLIGPALSAVASGSPDLYAASGVRITEAMTRLIEAAVAAGEIRADTDPQDVFRALLGFAYGSTAPGWEAAARRLIDIFMDGLRATR